MNHVGNHLHVRNAKPTLVYLWYIFTEAYCTNPCSSFSFATSAATRAISACVPASSRRATSAVTISDRQLLRCRRSEPLTRLRRTKIRVHLVSCSSGFLGRHLGRTEC